MAFKQVKRERIHKSVGDFKQITNHLPEIEVTEVPSKWLSYPKNSTIKYRPYTFGEIKKFNGSKMSDIDNIDFVLGGIECSFDKKKLTLPDFLFINLMRKMVTFGNSKFSVSYVCKCKETNTEQFTSDQIEFEELKIPELPIVFTSSIGDLHFSPVTINDYIELIKQGKETDEFEIMVMQCKNLDQDEARDKLYNLSTEEGSILEQIDQHLYHEIKPFKFKCKKCNSENDVEIEGGQAFVYPFREKHSRPVQTRIHFGL